MDNSLPKTDQGMGRFRVARNVYPTPDGDIIPRSEFEEIAGQSSNFRYVNYHTQYDSSILSVVSEDYGSVAAIRPHLYKDLNFVPEHIDCLGNTNLSTEDYDISKGFMSYRKNNTTYFCNPFDGSIFKYDGVEASSCGSQQPILSCADYISSGTGYIRVIQHCIDFDNNEPVSEYVQYRTNTAGNTVIRVDGGATNIIGNTNVLPTAVISPIVAESPYFYGTATYASNEYTITTTDTNIIFASQIGSYVIVNFQFTDSSVTGLTEDCLGYALKIKSISPLKLDATDAKYLSVNREWKSGTIAQAGVAAAISWGTRNVFTVWASNSANGNYVFRGICPSFPYSTTSRTFNIDVSSNTTPIPGSENLMFTISPNLGDWYDTQTRKLSPNAIYPYGSVPFRGLTQYQDQLLMWSDDLIWYSDPTLAGSFEQLNTSSFLRVGDTEFGQVMSVCGTQDFFMVSRERKNYFLNGTISTGNYRVQEMPEAEIGSWSNNTTINVKDSAIMLTAMGVYQVLGGGKTVKLSSKIPKNFSRFNSAGVNEDVVFSLIGTNINSAASSDIGISVAYDGYRELLVFMRKGPSFSGNPCLVLHTASGEFYEWNGIVSNATYKATSIGAINGQFVVGFYNPTAATLGAKSLQENTSLALSYPATFPCQMFSTWLTAGEPSLEKEVCQLKMFGNITPNGTTSSIKVVHFKDWSYATRITDVTFYPVSSSTYSNKQRLNADKVLAVSCGIELASASCYFRIESLEVEFNPIQQGMKR